MEEKKGFWKGLVAGLMISILICGMIIAGKQIYTLVGLLAEQKAASAQSDASDTEAATDSTSTSFIDDSATINKMQTLESLIDDYYYLDAVDDNALREGAYKGIFEALGDPYSVYYTADEFNALMEQTEGIYYGIGAYISTNPDTNITMISGVIAGTPAEEAGLLAGDQIYEVDGEDVTGLTSEEVVAKIKGEEGTTVVLTIYREGELNTKEFDIVRAKIESPTVTYKMYDDKIAYIGIMEFDEVTLDQFTEALKNAKNDGMLGLVLDLRDNPGGNLNIVNDIARQILPKGLIVYTEDKNGKREEYTCDGKNELTVPMVVLVNGNSASASEILAGAIKDYKKGTLLGTTTYGKGIVQRIIGLEDGSAVKITVSTYFTPNGNNIHKIGITPDEVLEFDADKYVSDGYDNQLERALEIIRTGK